MSPRCGASSISIRRWRDAWPSEVEDHLRDAAEADPAWPSPDAERRAVERFGLAREIAAQFAADAVDRQARRTWITLLVTVAVTFVAMRLRVDVAGMTATASRRWRRWSIATPSSRRSRWASIGWFAFRRSLLALAICLGGTRRLDRRRHRARRPLRRGAPLHVLLAAAGEIALIGLLVVPCHRARPAPEAYGDAAEGGDERMAAGRAACRCC